MSPRNLKATSSLSKNAKASTLKSQPLPPLVIADLSSDATTTAPPKSPSDTSTTTSTSPSTSNITSPSSRWFVNDLPSELQVRILSYLRAHDLSKVHQVNRYMANAKQLHHDIVLYCAEQVYPPKWTDGFQYQPTTSSATITQKPSPGSLSGSCNAFGKSKAVKGKPRSCSFGSLEDDAMAIKNRAAKSRSSSLGSIDDDGCSGTTTTNTPSTQLTGKADLNTGSSDLLIQEQPLFTFEHLRNMELLVVARVLNSPEPATGYVVSKSWCKTALCWLEGQQERRYEQQQLALQAALETGSGSNKKKKMVKKLKTKSTRKTHQRATTPPPNINSDITCAHDQLQRCTSTKSVRARRRLLDKQAWKILKALYPESTPIPAQSGECIQCIAEACQIQKMEHDQQEALKEQRKLPLQNPHIRRFYTRTRGVPEMFVRASSRNDDFVSTTEMNGASGKDECPLIDGTYYVLPRSWCHGWRRFIKTGEGSAVMNHTNGTSTYSPPDASCLLCDAHRLALLPPHLEAYLYGESDHLFDSSSSYNNIRSRNIGADPAPAVATLYSESTEHQYPLVPPGQGPTQESILAMRSLGLDEYEIGRQLSALRVIEARNERLNQHDDISTNAISRNELLDQENYHVVEILSETEFRSLLGCWSASTSVYVLRFIVNRGIVSTIAATTERDSLMIGSGQEEASRADFCISICRNCDATGRYHCVKGKQRLSRSSNSGSWNKKHHHTANERSRATTSLEY
jgi:hypothetical protein